MFVLLSLPRQAITQNQVYQQQGADDGRDNQDGDEPGAKLSEKASHDSPQ
jgi:hypothetical protein